MESFKMKKTSGDEDVTTEALVWLGVFLFVVAPLLFLFYLFMS